MTPTTAAQQQEAAQSVAAGEPPLEVRPTRFGKGVFARREFKAGDRILQFRGRIYSRAEYLSKVNPVKCHYMQIGDNAFLGPTTTPDNFVNHCCEPNAGLKVENGKAYLVAITAIHPEQEITFDYSTSMAEDHWEMDCACGVPSCRSRVRDFKHLSPSLQQKYIELGVVPDFVIRSAGMENPHDLFHALSATAEKSEKRRRISTGKGNQRNNANLGPSLNHAPRTDGIHASADLSSSLNHASPTY